MRFKLMAVFASGMLAGGVLVTVASVCIIAHEERKSRVVTTKKAAVDPQESTRTAIPEAIRLLEEGEYRVFLETFVSPNELTELLEGGTLEQFEREFGAKKASELLQILKDIEREIRAPAFNGDATIASYEVDGRPSLVLDKIQRKWYIRN